MDPDRQDATVRKAAFDWLEAQTDRHPDALPRGLLAQGFEWHGQRVPLVGPTGIFKPRVLPDIPLTITTVPNGPYEDSFHDEHRLLYRYRGTEPRHRDNVGLREAMRRRVPLIYLFRLIPGRYAAIWPVFIVEDDPENLAFTVMADTRDTIADTLQRRAENEINEEPDALRRQYITSAVQRRLHQRTFRERVLKAYHEQCALCRLRHREFLDAGHIIPDTDPRSEPEVSNGLALCKIHHAAFDGEFLGIRPDNYRIEIRQDVLDEHDGPMLQHGLQGMHGKQVQIPSSKRNQPSREALKYRYERFIAQ